MIKVGIITAAFTLLCLGLYEFWELFQYPGRSPDWKVTDGWVTEVGGDYSFGMPGKKLQNVDVNVQDQHVTYAYNVDGLLYYERQTVPFNFSPISFGVSAPPIADAVLNNDDEIDPDDFENTSMMGQVQKMAAQRPLARMNEKTRRLEVLVDPGMTLQSNYATNHMGEKWAEIPQEQWDQFMPRVKIKYDPNNPHHSITEPDMLNGQQNLLWSGVIALAGAFLLVAGMFFHAWVTKPAAEEEPAPYPGSPKRRY